MYCVLAGRNCDSADQEFLGCFRKVAIEALPSHGRSISDQAKLREARGAWDQARLIFVVLPSCAGVPYVRGRCPSISAAGQSKIPNELTKRLWTAIQRNIHTSQLETVLIGPWPALQYCLLSRHWLCGLGAGL
jgi:hypothetical protein